VATLQQLERRVQTGEELRSVVRTMKGLAAVAIHEYEDAVRALHEYTATIEQGLQILFMRHPEAIPDPPQATGRVATVVVGTDQGLCGPINREIVRHARWWLDDQDVPQRDRLIVGVGLRVVRELTLAGIEVTEQPALPGSVEAIGRCVDDVISRIDGWRSREGVERVAIVFQHPIRRTQRAPRVFQVVPPDAARLRHIAERRWPTRMLPSSPQARGELLRGLLREDLFIALYRAVAEAKTAEHGARLSAMQAAEQNIADRLDHLRMEYHQQRQAEITAELLDVISGFEALSDATDR
jgi:F-type H+-transporting ATPase subunit gamma